MTYDDRGAALFLTIIAIVLVALTLASEVVSFSKVVARVPPLNAIDRLGRRPQESAS